MIPRDTILQRLHELQAQSGRHWLSPADLQSVADEYQLSGATVKGIADYYSMFSLTPRGRHHICLCVSPVCRMAGADDLLNVAAEASGAKPGGVDASGLFSLEAVQCLGRCAGSPAMTIDGHTYTGLNADRTRSLIAAWQQAAMAGAGSGGSAVAAAGTKSIRAVDLSAAAGSVPKTALSDGPARLQPARVVLRYPEQVEPENAAAYAAGGGYAGLVAALKQAPEALVEAFVKAKVRGRGGAGFPTGLKERAAAGSACPAEEDCIRYVVCNADEGEPGTFKDRIIMERTPQALIEGMLISAYAVGARQGYVYIRGEYEEAILRVRGAIASAYDHGYLGNNILGSDFCFDLALRIGAGSYLCGEELTLIESLEGKRGHPRIKPPFPAEAGLWGRPTLVNNVETLATLPWVAEYGADAYLQLGTAESPGTKLFCVSGDVARPGYGEWELGVRLGDILEAAGGVVDSQGRPADKPLAVLLGGAAGCFVSGDALDLRMSYDELRAAGASLGSGAVIVLGPGRSLSSMLCTIMEFFAHESCGKCVPCRVGTKRLALAAAELSTLADGSTDTETLRQRIAALADDAERIAKASLCPLGQSPVLALRSAVRNLDRLF